MADASCSMEYRGMVGKGTASRGMVWYVPRYGTSWCTMVHHTMVHPGMVHHGMVNPGSLLASRQLDSQIFPRSPHPLPSALHPPTSPFLLQNPKPDIFHKLAGLPTIGWCMVLLVMKVLILVLMVAFVLKLA